MKALCLFSLVFLGVLFFPTSTAAQNNCYCGNCNGSGWTERLDVCNYCVAGSTSCLLCGGRGFFKCTQCMGFGTVYVKCGTCYGTGRVDGERCESCSGTGEFQEVCSGCDGTGNISCYRCGGNGAQTCTMCNGTGQTTWRDPCSVCSQTGRVPCE